MRVLACHREVATTVINLIEVPGYLLGATVDKLSPYLARRHPVLVMFTYSDHIGLGRQTSVV